MNPSRTDQIAIKTFLTMVGVTYLCLAVWCALQPVGTSQAIGFQIASGSGHSEYLTVYGGLQFGLGLLFLWPLIRNAYVESTLRLCLVIHGSIVGFRTLSFGIYQDIHPVTIYLAVGEWCLFILSVLAVGWYHRQR